MNTSRRDFMKESLSLISGAFVIGCFGTKFVNMAMAASEVQGSEFNPNLFVAIGKDGKITLVCHRTEMGQGARTSMPMLIAEELEMDLKSIHLLQADGDAKYGDQNTDGSKSVVLNWTRLREAGAAAREMLITAAAGQWKVSTDSCYAKEGQIFHKPSGKSLTYGQLAEAASKLPVPAHPKLKPDSEFKLVGKAQPIYDIDNMTSGKAIYGIDTVVDQMVYASIERAPSIHAEVKSVESKNALAIPGVMKVIQLEGDPKYTNHSVAVIAKDTWTALQGRKALKIEWKNRDPNGTEKLRADLKKAIEEPGKVFRKEGDFDSALKSASKVIEGRYTAPHLVHATMEPMSGVAHFKDGSCEVWAPSQDPQTAQKEVARVLGIDPSKVHIHVTLLGGGFGRKSQPDFLIEAALLSKKIGKPVKVTFTREDEIQHGFYHAESAQRITAGLDAKGKIVAWRHRSAFPTIMRMFDPKANEVGKFEVGMGVTNLPYHIPNLLCEGTDVPTPVRVAWLRSVCNIYHCFAINSFMDEVAHTTHRDPVQMRMDLLEPFGPLDFDKDNAASGYQLDSGRLANVIKIAAKESGWGKKHAKGTGVGFACHYSFKSYIAVVLEVKVVHDQIKVVRADVVVDCGKYVNPDTVKSQMEGSVIFGMSAALYGEITIKEGSVEQTNFHEYPLVRMPEAPQIHVHLVKNDAAPAGVGEPGVPPIAPALCNAIFQATGKRVRDLPLSKHFKG